MIARRRGAGTPWDSAKARSPAYTPLGMDGWMDGWTRGRVSEGQRGDEHEFPAAGADAAAAAGA
jgi:hypothetical protein